MLKLLIKFAIAALVVNACWRLGSAYATFYRFRDAVGESAQFSSGRTEDALRQRVLDLATQFDVPLAEDSFTIRRENDHTYIDGEYTQPVEIAPGFKKPWTFKFDVEAFVAQTRIPQ